MKNEQHLISPNNKWLRKAVLRTNKKKKFWTLYFPRFFLPVSKTRRKKIRITRLKKRERKGEQDKNKYNKKKEEEKVLDLYEENVKD